MTDEFGHEHTGSPFDSLKDAFTPGNGPECMVCPICLMLYGLRQARPEVMEHLVKASTEMILAFKAIVDQAAAKAESNSSLHRITID